MAIQQETNRVAWLSARLSTHTHRIMSLLGRLGDLGVMQMLKPALFQKFLNLMEQIAAEKDKESDVISEIEAVERKHRIFRKEGKLLQAEASSGEAYNYIYESDNHSCEDDNPSTERPDFTNDTEDQKAKRSAYGWLWFLAFWFQTSYGRNNNQSDPAIVTNIPGDGNLKNKRNPRGWLWLIAFWFLLSRRDINNKNHRLTHD